ncbi:hypothetical protein ACE6H2_012904 [Prunus campanulata]
MINKYKKRNYIDAIGRCLEIRVIVQSLDGGVFKSQKNSIELFKCNCFYSIFFFFLQPAKLQ